MKGLLSWVWEGNPFFVSLDCAGHEHGTELFLKRGRNAGTWKTVVIFSPSMESV